MQKKIFYSAISIFFIGVFIIACKKNSDYNNNTPKTKTELISASVWKFDNAKVSGVDISGFLDDCDKDNTVTFVSNGSGTADEGPTKCNSADPQTVSFTWTFENNETTLQATAPLFPGGNGTFTIVTLTDAQLVVSQDITVSGVTQNAVITLKH
jgi:Lipocalin-like domain